MPSSGRFYHEGMTIHIRAARAAEIRHWSTLNERDMWDVDDKLNHIMQNCTRIQSDKKMLSWKDILEEDRIHVILAIRDLTFKEGENKLQITKQCPSCGTTNTIDIKNANFQPKLYIKNPDALEGQLAKLRAAVVNAKALADVARTLGLGEFLLLGKGEEATGGRDKSSILADAVEAILGAIYVEHGLVKSGEVILQLFAPILAASAELGAGLDWKTSLAELVNSKSLGAIEYVIEQSGPDHDKRFSAQVKVGQDLYGNGEGKSKKEAEQHAAASAYTEINNLRP